MALGGYYDPLHLLEDNVRPEALQKGGGWSGWFTTEETWQAPQKICRSNRRISQNGVYQCTIDRFNLEKITLQWLNILIYETYYNAETMRRNYICIYASGIRENGVGKCESVLRKP